MSDRGRELYDVWADEKSPWSAWAKPAVFATVESWPANPPALPTGQRVDWALPADGRTAVIVDLPDGDAVTTGLALARAGYRPVPLFNGCSAKGMVVDVDIS